MGRKQFLYEASVMAVYQPRRFRHEYLGEVTGTGGEIFTNLKLRPITKRKKYRISIIIKRGLDLGVSIDPMAYMTMHLDNAARKLYIFNNTMPVAVRVGRSRTYKKENTTQQAYSKRYPA